MNDKEFAADVTRVLTQASSWHNLGTRDAFCYLSGALEAKYPETASALWKFLSKDYLISEG